MNEQPRKVEAEGFVLQVRRIGNSVGLILPKELLARANLQEGDKLHVIEQTERTIKLSPYDPEHVETMNVAREVMHEYQDTFRALAK